MAIRRPGAAGARRVEPALLATHLGSMRISFTRDLRGRAAIDDAGRVIGVLEEVFVDNRSWRIEAFRIRLRREAARELGVPHNMFQSATVEIPVEMVRAAGDAIILNVPASSLRELKAAEDAVPAGP